MKSLVILGFPIATTDDGLMSLTDIWKGSGRDNRKRPGYFLENKSAVSLLSELQDIDGVSTHIRVSKGGVSPGTFGSKVIALKYIEWIYGPAVSIEITKKLDDFDSIIRAMGNFEVPDDLHDMYVYAIRESESGNVKLGISRDPQKRLIQLQTGNSHKLELIAYQKAINKYKDEGWLHSENEQNLIHGEWFSAVSQESARFLGMKGN